jgi:hypothetical protein
MHRSSSSPKAAETALPAGLSLNIHSASKRHSELMMSAIGI